MNMKDKKKINEDNRKSDGINLSLGSPEYREYVMDKKGIDEKVQENVKKSLNNSKRSDYYNTHSGKIKSKEEIKSEKDLNNNKVDDEIDKDLIKKEKGEAIEKDFESMVNNQIINKRLKKRVMEDKILRDAKERVLETESLEDDKYVRKTFTKKLNDAVFDNSKDFDDMEYDL